MSDHRLWGPPTCGVVTTRYSDGSVLIRQCCGAWFSGQYGDLQPGDAVVIHTGDYWLPEKVSGKKANDIKAYCRRNCATNQK